MNKLFILCCLNIICIIYAAPIKSNATINEILQQLEFLKKCPAVLNNNIDIHKSNGGLSHCKNVSIGNAPELIDLSNLNEFHCIGLLAADIQLCSGNRTNKLPNNYDDLKTYIDKIKNEKAEKICAELKQLKLFDEIENVTNLKKWIEVLDKNLHTSMCLGFCTEIESGNTNLLCSMIYYINNNISYVTIPEKKVKEIPGTTVTPSTNNDNAQQKVTKSPLSEIENKSEDLKVNVQEKNKNITPVNIKDNAPTQLEPKVTVKPVVVEIPPKETVNSQQEVQTVDKPPKELQTVDKSPKEVQAVVEATTVKQVALIPNQKDSVNNTAPVKIVDITEETKTQQQQLPAVKLNPIVEENQKVPSNVESSSVSSTISGVRDELNEEYFEEVDEINKENEDQLIAQTNPRKETIEILANEQDRHRMPSEDGEDMEESNFFSYFMFVSVMFIAGYVVYHNKQKIMALLLEGRRDRNSRRRPNTASYRKLNSNLEEAVTSKCSGSASHVIY